MTSFTVGPTHVTEATTVKNTAPNLGSLEITPTPVREETTAKCTPSGWSDPDPADSEMYEWEWLVDGQPAGTKQTLTGGDFDRAQKLACKATPTDGDAYGSTLTSDPVVVQNTPPTINTVTISPTMPDATDTLQANVSGKHDADGDNVQLNYAWRVNGAVAHQGKVLTGAYFRGGDTIELEVTPTDGTDEGQPVTSNSVTVVNSPPTVSSVQLSPPTVRTDTTITARTMTSDPDGDAVNLTFDWRVDGQSVCVQGPKLDGTQHFDEGQTVRLQVTPSDGKVQGQTVTSMPVTVQNTPPGKPAISISPSNARPDDNLTCNVDTDAPDADGDNVTYSYQWSGPRMVSGKTVSSSQTSGGETWNCTVTPNDGQADGTPSSASRFVGNQPPSAPTVEIQPAKPKTGDNPCVFA